MSTKTLYDNMMRSMKLSKGDEEVFRTFVEILKRKYPKCQMNFNIKMRTKNSTLKSRPFKNSRKMYYAIFKAVEERCKKQNGGTRKKTRRE